MIDVAFDRVSKRYRVRQSAASGGGLHDFWAVRDVSFDVARGEAFGLVGHNGAGKSTILKMLSQITTPTQGEIRLAGRVAALIEVGSGFHPELTGRENVYLSGSILGMRRREIQAKFDRIVEFSGVGQFIDTPVKWYSSGMYVRLGFAVAAHLDPDILLVDEVLAVGDAAFQVQCIERLNELRRAGMTMLFISHDLLSIERLCDRVAIVEKGRLVAHGSPHEIVAAYQQMTATSHVAAMADANAPSPDAAARVEGVTFHDENASEVLTANTGEPLVARVHYMVQRAVRDAVVEVFYYSRDGRVLHCQQSTAVAGGELTLLPGRGAVEFSMPGLGLQPGVYAIGATIRERSASETIDWWYGRTALCVEPGRAVRGYFYTPHDWRLVVEHGQGGSSLQRS
ncbi:MAG TPA: ABC transporter ATP-binding protein [Vicinamibacterales bacterium]|jgi:ABC-type polysaccharide/polyol phosphate transport system ATPase subunit|nr:ABC transporter ATP-binding protein [Vicinamibacterales bacterium]